VNLPDFYFQTLGENSAVPFANRFPSSFILGNQEGLCLIDCGEGSQIKMSEFHVRRNKIDHILISHLHGDHIFGLPGFINSLALNGRKKALHITGPIGIKNYIEQVLSTTNSQLPFELHWKELTDSVVTELGIANGLKVVAFPLLHRIPTFGYRFTEVIVGRNINPEAIGKFELNIPEILQVKQGLPISRKGLEIELDEVLLPPRKARSFAYCSDTVYHPEVVPNIKNVDLLYHEATYLHESHVKAQKYMHSTAQEAATIARAAAVGKLLIGHYSSRYNNLSLLQEEARMTFQNSHLALQGEIHAIESIS